MVNKKSRQMAIVIDVGIREFRKDKHIKYLMFSNYYYYCFIFGKKKKYFRQLNHHLKLNNRIELAVLYYYVVISCFIFFQPKHSKKYPYYLSM